MVSHTRDTNMESILHLTPTKREEFERQGAVLIKKVFDDSWLKKIESGIQENLQNPSSFSESIRDELGGGVYFNDYFNWSNIKDFRDVVTSSPAARVAGFLMGTQQPVFYHEHVLTKDEGTRKGTPWHHDQSYYPLDGNQNVSLWIPIDPVPRSAGIRFVSGSHKWGRWFYPRKFATEKNYPIEFKDENSGRRYENIPADLDDETKYEILSWDCKPGDCVAFHMRTLHAANPNLSNTTKRRVVSFRWIGTDNTLAKRPWHESPPLHLHQGLQLGDGLQKNKMLFPIIALKDCH